MNWHDWLQVEQNQFVVVLGMLASMIAYMIGHKKGERQGYEDGVRVMYKTVVVNMLDENDYLRKRINHEC